MTTTKEKIEIMQTWVDGKEVQYQPEGLEKWIDLTRDNIEPAWDWDRNNYRIKPQPKVIWVNEYCNNKTIHDDKHSAHCHATSDAIRVAVKYQEVIE